MFIAQEVDSFTSWKLSFHCPEDRNRWKSLVWTWPPITPCSIVCSSPPLPSDPGIRIPLHCPVWVQIRKRQQQQWAVQKTGLCLPLKFRGLVTSSSIPGFGWHHHRPKDAWTVTVSHLPSSSLVPWFHSLVVARLSFRAHEVLGLPVPLRPFPTVFFCISSVIWIQRKCFHHWESAVRKTYSSGGGREMALPTLGWSAGDSMPSVRRCGCACRFKLPSKGLLRAPLPVWTEGWHGSPGSTSLPSLQLPPKASMHSHQ